MIIHGVNDIGHDDSGQWVITVGNEDMYVPSHNHVLTVIGDTVAIETIDGQDKWDNRKMG